MLIQILIVLSFFSFLFYTFATMSENEDFELASDDEIDSGDSNDEELDVGINVSEDKKV